VFVRSWAEVLGDAEQASSSAREAVEALTPWSVKTRAAPASRSASSCSWGFWSVVLTRPYPMMATRCSWCEVGRWRCFRRVPNPVVGTALRVGQFRGSCHRAAEGTEWRYLVL
jgi:hypothetical protein